MGKTTLRWLSRIGAGGLWAIAAYLTGLVGNTGPDGVDPAIATGLGGVLAFVATSLANWVTGLAGPKPDAPTV